MRKKIIGMIILILVVPTVVSSTQVNMKENNRTTASEVDVPVWEKGDSWTYKEHYINHGYNEDGILWDLWYHNCTSTYTITDVCGENYRVKMTSTNNEGSQIISKLRMKYTPRTKLSGEFIIKKTDLSYISYSQTEKGFVFLGTEKIYPFLPGQFYDTWGGRYTPLYILLPFPLTAGTNGTLANFSWVIHENSSFYWGLIKGLIDHIYFGYSGEQKYTCEMASISVPAGNYDTYNVTIEYTGSKGYTHISSYYSPEIGWFVEQSYDYIGEIGKPGYFYKCELVSTTYTP